MRVKTLMSSETQADWKHLKFFVVWAHLHLCTEVLHQQTNIIQCMQCSIIREMEYIE